MTVPTEEYIESLWRAVKAGAISWDDVRSLQAGSMPRCAPHGAAAVGKWDGAPVCEACVKERRDGRAAIQTLLSRDE